jgi:hypothetical protein
VHLNGAGQDRGIEDDGPVGFDGFVGVLDHGAQTWRE